MELSVKDKVGQCKEQQEKIISFEKLDYCSWRDEHNLNMHLRLGYIVNLQHLVLMTKH